MSIKKVAPKGDHTGVNFIEMGNGKVGLLLDGQLLKPSDHLQNEKTQKLCLASDFVEEMIRNLDNPGSWHSAEDYRKWSEGPFPEQARRFIADGPEKFAAWN